MSSSIPADHDDALQDGVGDALARKLAPVAEFALIRHLRRRNGPQGEDLAGALVREAQERRAAQEAASHAAVQADPVEGPQDIIQEVALLPPPAPGTATQLDSLAVAQNTAAAIDRATADDPATPDVDERDRGLDEAGRHQAYADSMPPRLVTMTRPSPRSVRVPVGPRAVVRGGPAARVSRGRSR